MAAPCVRMTSRPLLQFLKFVCPTAFSKTGVRPISASYAYRSTLKTQSKTESIASPWKLMGAVYLQRLPIISQDRNPVEEQFAELMHRVSSRDDVSFMFWR